MKKSICSLLLVFTFSQLCHAQLPAATCGIVVTYDNAGNRIKREAVCNPAPVAALQPAHTEFAAINALRPNPTTGKFVISFTQELKNASVQIAAANGAVLQQFTISGLQHIFDISKYANGEYFITINNSGNTVSLKVIKEE